MDANTKALHALIVATVHEFDDAYPMSMNARGDLSLRIKDVVEEARKIPVPDCQSHAEFEAWYAEAHNLEGEVAVVTLRPAVAGSAGYYHAWEVQKAWRIWQASRGVNIDKAST
jgi:hypothetical protein